MNNIQQLIQQLCPNGVEYKRLGEVCVSLPKGTLKKNDLIDNGIYNVMNSGRSFYGKYNKYNNEGNAFTIAARGEYAGYVNYIDERFWAGGLCYPFRSKDDEVLSCKFAFYWLKHSEKLIMDTLVARGSIPALNKTDLENILIPLPPLPVQQAIAATLDTFTELETELEYRKKQYEYYRNQLLTFKRKEN